MSMKNDAFEEWLRVEIDKYEFTETDKVKASSLAHKVRMMWIYEEARKKDLLEQILKELYKVTSSSWGEPRQRSSRLIDKINDLKRSEK